jgi:hypothetical protein
MSRIQEKILALYTKRLIRTGRAVRTSVGFQQAQNMGILYSANNPQKHEAARHLASQLNKMGKQVAGLCYATVPIQATNLAFPTITHSGEPSQTHKPMPLSILLLTTYSR